MSTHCNCVAISRRALQIGSGDITKMTSRFKYKNRNRVMFAMKEKNEDVCLVPGRSGKISPNIDCFVVINQGIIRMIVRIIMTIIKTEV